MKSALFLLVALQVTVGAVTVRAHYHPHRKHYRPYHIEYTHTEIEHVYDVDDSAWAPEEHGGGAAPEAEPPKRTLRRTREVHKSRTVDPAEIWADDDQDRPTVQRANPKHSAAPAGAGEPYVVDEPERVARREVREERVVARPEAPVRRVTKPVQDDNAGLAQALPKHEHPRTPERPSLFDTNVSSPQSRWAQPAVGLDDGPAVADERAPVAPREREARPRRERSYEAEDDRAFLGNEHGESRTSGGRGAWRSGSRARKSRTSRTRPAAGDRASDDEEPAGYWWGSARRAAPRDSVRSADNPDDERESLDPAVHDFLELRHQRGRRPDDSYAVQLAPEPAVPRAESASPYVSLFSAQRGALTHKPADPAVEATIASRTDAEIIADATPFQPATRGGRKLLSAARERVAAQQDLAQTGTETVAGPQLAGTSPFAGDKVAGDSFSGPQKDEGVETAGPKLAGVVTADVLPEVASTLLASSKVEEPAPVSRDALVAQLPAVPRWTVKRWNPADGAVDVSPASMTQGARDRSMPLDLATDDTPKPRKKRRTSEVAARPAPAPELPPALATPSAVEVPTPALPVTPAPDALAHLTQQAQAADRARQAPDPAPDAATAQTAAEQRQAQVAQQVAEQVAQLKAEQARAAQATAQARTAQATAQATEQAALQLRQAEQARREQLDLQLRQAEQARQAQLALQAQNAERARQAALALEAQRAELARQAQLAQQAAGEAARKQELAAQAERARQAQAALEAQRAEAARQAELAAQRAEAARQAQLALQARQDSLAADPVPKSDLRSLEPGLNSEPGAAEMYAQREAIANALAYRKKGGRRTGTAWSAKAAVPRGAAPQAPVVAAPELRSAAPVARPVAEPELYPATPPAQAPKPFAPQQAPAVRTTAVGGPELRVVLTPGAAPEIRAVGAAPEIRAVGQRTPPPPPVVVAARPAPRLTVAPPAKPAMGQRVMIHGQSVIIGGAPKIATQTTAPRVAGRSEMPLTLAGVPDAQVDRPTKPVRPHVEVDVKTATAAPGVSNRLANSLRRFLDGAPIGAPVPTVTPVAPVPPAPPMRVAQRSAPRPVAPAAAPAVAPAEPALPPRKVDVSTAPLPPIAVPVATPALPPLESGESKRAVVAVERPVVRPVVERPVAKAVPQGTPQGGSPYRRISALREGSSPSATLLVENPEKPVKRVATRDSSLSGVLRRNSKSWFGKSNEDL